MLCRIDIHFLIGGVFYDPGSLTALPNGLGSGL